MFKHVILFKSKQPELIRSICEHVIAIKEEMPGLLEVEYFENLTDNTQGYDQMAVMSFDRRGSFSGWQNHPYHAQAVKQLKEFAELIFFDYER
ncbi:MAG: Dabb family protein [Gammaproteobacteria bacterium]|nr:Dabb family protein [Gammaproteobacteria bacterium]